MVMIVVILAIIGMMGVTLIKSEDDADDDDNNDDYCFGNFNISCEDKNDRYANYKNGDYLYDW